MEVGRDLSVIELRKEFDALLLATGAQEPRKLDVEGIGMKGVHYAMDYLPQRNREVAGDKIPVSERIDAAGKNISVARSHAEAAMLNINYQPLSIENLSEKNLAFDVVIALEVIEHVVNLDKFLENCVKLTKEKGCLILSTLNRTAKAFTLAILGAEYFLRWLPKGTHRWEKFVKPSELDNNLSKNGATVTEIAGLTYNLLKTEWQLSKDVSVNYLIFAKKIK